MRRGRLYGRRFGPLVGLIERLAYTPGIGGSTGLNNRLNLTTRAFFDVGNDSQRWKNERLAEASL
jgi:hypothetical protein